MNLLNYILALLSMIFLDVAIYYNIPICYGLSLFWAICALEYQEDHK